MDGGCSSFLGRRGLFDKCYYWERNESNVNLNEYTHNTKPSGMFYAREVNAESKSKMVVNNLFMFDNNTITIYTTASIDLKKGDLVKFRGKIWICGDCQFKNISGNTQFMNRANRECYISLKR